MTGLKSLLLSCALLLPAAAHAQSSREGVLASFASEMGLTEVRFSLAGAGRKQAVTVSVHYGNDDLQECEKPINPVTFCTLALPPGPAKVVVHGSVEKTFSFQVPEHPVNVAIRYAPAGAGTVIFSFIGGVAGLEWGTVGLADLHSKKTRADGEWEVGLGAAFLLTAIPFDYGLLRSSWRLEVEGAPPAPPAPDPVPRVGLAIDPATHAGALALSWTF